MISYFSSYPDVAAIRSISGMRLKIYQVFTKLTRGSCQWNYKWCKDLNKNGKKKKNVYNISWCQVHFHFPWCVFDESVLKSIDVASAEIKIVWSVHRFPFQWHIRYVSGEGSLCKWRDADMDIQYIWLGLTLGVLRGITNVWTVINWLVPCLLSFESYR